MAKMTQAEMLDIVKKGEIENNKLFSVLKYLKPKKEKQIETGFVLNLKLNQNYQIVKKDDGWSVKMLTGELNDKSLCPKGARNMEELVIIINGFDYETRGMKKKS